ncbi:major facilitator super transporter protein [Coniosporium apollinis]|uniref:GPI ethanolamine phosphate transferase 2 n=1 Tax=Coniosporium apollinis TaxID=61459 RepID=A0ABQ9NRG6_9PEZI|nr:major facilitator super transporter protein [Coniosporium apollinis]
MAWSTKHTLLAAANILIPIAVLTFASGFFPYKPFLPGLAEYQKLEYGVPPKAPFDKLVFMVVDALRSDFVYSARSGFQFTQSLIRSGAAIPFTAHATSPTITMPRVKAITTGSIPSFLDVILNFAESDTTSTLAYQDTWLAQMKAKEGGSLVFYGDDTWLKLFPETFTRADGTSSFFVSDFTEVDNNVTRHVPYELHASDWNAMIMHYLGLDHIGHKAGPLSPNMLPKQTEMDGIVKQIYQAIEREQHLQSTLFVLCGDHGMNEGGNHGGSAPGETSPALVFLSPKLREISNGHNCPTEPKRDFEYYTVVEQSDIAPTLAGLLGFPVPLNNLGVFIPKFLDFWPEGKDRVQLLHRNALQMLTIAKATFPGSNFDNHLLKMDCTKPSSSGDELACMWRRATHMLRRADDFRSRPEDVLAALLEFCRRTQEVLSQTASNYNLTRLLLGIVAAIDSLVLALIASRRDLLRPKSAATLFGLFSALYLIMMFASSYVEEEQHFWYWITSPWICYVLLFASRDAGLAASGLLIPICLRIARRWNQTGQKHAGAPDIVNSFLAHHQIFLWLMISCTYILLALRLGLRLSVPNRSGTTLVGRIVTAWLCTAAFVFKLSFTARDAPELVEGLPEAVVAGVLQLSLLGLARTVFWTLLVGVLLLVGQRVSSEKHQKRPNLARTLHDLLEAFLITQTRAQNIPLYLLFRTILWCLTPLRLPPTIITITTLLLSHFSFFALGNSNAISSIDLSNAYNGISGYNVIAVGLLLFAGNWAGPVWWAAAGVCLLLEKEGGAAAEVKKSRDGSDGSRNWVREERERLHLAALVSGKAEPSEKDAGKDAFGEAPNSIEKASPVATPPKEESSGLFVHIATSTIFTALSLVAVMAACTALRTHLFIWTVFSPKYLYSMAWSIAYHLGINVGLCSLLWWAGKV